MKSALYILALAIVGCASNDAPSSTSSADTSAKTPVASNTPPADKPVTSTATTSATPTGATTAPAPTSAPAPQDKKAADGSVFNEDGKIDKGLPKTAGYGARLPKDGDPIAIINTNKGRIVLKFFPTKAPNHVKNFLTLAGKKFYDGTRFHRVIPGFMIQGGDPNTKSKDHSGWGMGGPGYNVKAEFNDVLHQPGILSMARTGDPNGAGSQFFIMHGRAESLDNQYSVFGEVIEGMDVVNKIVTAPRDERDAPLEDVIVSKVEVTKWPVKLK